MSDRRRVVVLFGGRSAEHEISLHLGALGDRRARPRARRGGADRDHEGRDAGTCCPARRRCRRRPAACPRSAPGAGAAVELAAEGASRELVAADGSRAPIDVVFPVLHGPMGEDGAVQGLLELAGVPYVGAGRARLRGRDGQGDAEGAVRGGRAPRRARRTVVREPEWDEDPEGVAARVAALGFPVFVKPATLGSSVGITKVHDHGELGAGAGGGVPVRAQGGRGAGRSRPIREIECAVLGNDDPVASVVGEIVPDGPRVLRLRGEVPRRPTARGSSIPADLDARGARTGSSGWRSRRSGPSSAGGWRASTSSCAASELWIERDQHDPGVHVDLDVPEALGGERARLPATWSSG